MTTTADTTTIVKEITIDAPAGRVFSALTEPDQLRQWWDDEMHKLESFEADVRVGGTWRMKSLTPQKHEVHGEFTLIESPRVLEYTWIHQNFQSAGTTVVRFELQEQGGKTRLRLTHSGFTDAEMREDHDEGWTIVLGWLDRFAAKPNA